MKTAHAGDALRRVPSLFPGNSDFVRISITKGIHTAGTTHYSTRWSSPHRPSGSPQQSYTPFFHNPDSYASGYFTISSYHSCGAGSPYLSQTVIAGSILKKQCRDITISAFLSMFNFSNIDRSSCFLIIKNNALVYYGKSATTLT